MEISLTACQIGSLFCGGPCPGSPLVRPGFVLKRLPMDVLITTLFAAVVGIVGWFRRGWFTPAKRSERYDLAGEMLDVREKLKPAGFDATHFEHFVATPRKRYDGRTSIIYAQGNWIDPRS